eukprot:3491461-Prymnesium_polylepis.3
MTALGMIVQLATMTLLLASVASHVSLTYSDPSPNVTHDIHAFVFTVRTCVATGGACLSGCWVYALTLHGAGAPAAARAWPPHPMRVVEMGETARTSCDRHSWLRQPLTHSCLRQPCVHRQLDESAPHGWCCSARIADALHAERTHGWIARAAERVRATRHTTALAHRQRHGARWMVR